MNVTIRIEAVQHTGERQLCTHRSIVGLEEGVSTRVLADHKRIMAWIYGVTIRAIHTCCGCENKIRSIRHLEELIENV